MNVFKILTNKPFRRNLLNARNALRGRPIMVATTRAVPETFRERNMIPSSSALKLIMRVNALLKASIIEFMIHHDT